MLEGRWTEVLQVVAAVASAIAAGAAAWAAIAGPSRAARLAEQMRQENDRRNEERRIKLVVFGTLLQERGNLASVDGMRALNMTEFAFRDSRMVREALAAVYRAIRNDAPAAAHTQDELIIALLNEMAKDLGLSSAFTTQDLNRAFVPRKSVGPTAGLPDFR